jgi:hypothetical protein
MKSLKSVLKFWQEIVFVVSIGLLLIEVTKWVIQSQTMDGWDIFLICSLLPVFICLIGQFFWKNKTLAICLSVLLGLSSVIAIFMALYGIFNSPSYRTESIAMLFIGVLLLFSAITMTKKFNQSENLIFRTNNQIA